MTKIIPSFPLYECTTEGKIYRKGKELKHKIDRRGYHCVCLYDGNNNRKHMFVHRLVLLTFNNSEYSESLTVNHKDGNKNNNQIDNLEWMTNKENMAHAFKFGIRINEGAKKGKSYRIDKELLDKIVEINKSTGESIRSLAKKYNILPSTLSYQIRRNYRKDGDA